MTTCPNCGSREIGKIGTGQFFCRDCCVEMSELEGGLVIHQVEEDGSLSPIDEWS
ncbi:hypothetical protein [Domibacillus epiphyticus]|uniref:hypothetical protein n=1 Tax=Domibacillus epiphyticus TaxID=1714355 RepID=UPI0018E94521|nr:hypothetical protein [Domibacillus epiphyticus]